MKFTNQLHNYLGKMQNFGVAVIVSIIHFGNKEVDIWI